MSWVAVGVAAAGMIAANQKQKQQQRNADSQRKLASETQRYSPWTGMQAGPVQEPENTSFGATLGGGLAGYSMGKGMSGGMGAKPQQTTTPNMNSQQGFAMQQDAQMYDPYKNRMG